MRTINAALLAHLQGSVQTVCTLWLITRKDGQQFAFTDLDQPITYKGITYQAAGGYTHSQIETSSDLSTSNLEVQAIFDSSTITQASLESGQWDFAQATCSLVNWADLTQGAVVLETGYLGQVTISNGAYSVELRGLAQLSQQEQGDVYSPTCRANFGDTRCTINTAPLTFNGTVSSLNGATSWNAPTLTQTGPTVAYTDTTGHKVPTQNPFTIKVVPPTGGQFANNISVVDSLGNVLTQDASNPAQSHYSVDGTGTYTFNNNNAGGEVFINYDYTIGYFAYGKVTWLTGQNAGFSMEVKSFAPGVVTLAMAMPYPIAVGDTYTITAGCDKTIGTCSARYNNILHFRGEPYIPGPDILLSPQGS
ncbi:Uncharacterized conserved protein [Burkholderia pseudomallei]|uniref:DUF2163 domain-containing protein n=1 Tax=Burkholderia pseudomallei TaxID=28450 RepID=UPI0009758484|nr:DUF2163 domain-containing protein [Burkholderia pseudomallei]OMS46588.1 hypothetical protein AQ740_17970 [Burkholderia pseudomallei]CAJ3065672.1 Uncharacterized conserved protein [Burkholderia pseudomallei]CAJ3073637.1 Uncharacterized conserved protein [Burkholderia pseudomallei]CAJ3703201.1 Uncharacterized conserved protein [Burkholderia pseudomallei]CAJ3729502.1 Uncharacterized conserved protein [Burkholderia pseudomallei]